MAIIGIDLGTTNSLVTVFKDGKSILIPNEYQEYLTPSIVNVSKGIVYIGRAAKEKMITEPENTARQFKRDMGREQEYVIDGKKYLPEELSSLVLRKLVEDAERYLHEKVEEAVISVPAYFTDKQRYATKKAGELAGIKVERLVNEPSAAALLCKLNHPQEDGNYMVFDFGGGTLDISVVECFGNVVNVIAISGDNRLGGCDFDRAIAEAFCRENKLFFIDLSRQEQNSLLLQCEIIKKKLTEEETVRMDISLGEREYGYELSRKKLVDASGEVFKKIDNIVRRVLVDAQIEKNEIQEVIMVGGSGKMPVVQQYVRYLLGDEIPLLQEEPDTIVACGVGVYAGIKERKAEIKDIVLTDVCPFTLGIAVRSETNKLNGDLVMSGIIPRNAPLPVAKQQHYYTTTDFQNTIRLQVYQGENYYVKDNLKMGEMAIPVTPKPKGEERVTVTFSYDINGMLLVTAEVPSQRKQHRMVIVGRDESTEQERINRVRELASLKVEEENPENIALIRCALQIFEEAPLEVKIKINELLIAYERSLTSNRIQIREHAKKNLIAFLSLYKMHEHSMLENEFSQDWYESEE